MAGWTGLEPATFCVTGRRSKPAELPPLNWILLPYKSSGAFQKINALVCVTLLNPLKERNLLNM